MSYEFYANALVNFLDLLTVHLREANGGCVLFPFGVDGYGVLGTDR